MEIHVIAACALQTMFIWALASDTYPGFIDHPEDKILSFALFGALGAIFGIVINLLFYLAALILH